MKEKADVECFDGFGIFIPDGWGLLHTQITGRTLALWRWEAPPSTRNIVCNIYFFKPVSNMFSELYMFGVLSFFPLPTLICKFVQLY